MLVKSRAAVLVSLIFALALPTVTLAQTSPAQAQQSPLFAEIQAKIVRTIGAAPLTVEMQTGSIITVLRINSNMNEATHSGRDNEASAIAPIVADAVAGKSEFKNLTTIRVQYVIQSAPGTTSKVVDTVDFRKSPSGTFEFHKT